MTRAELEALAIWREREMTFPPRVRRMTPDHMDRVSGAWQRVIERALAQGAKDDQ